MKDKECSLCHKKFDTGYRFKQIQFVHAYSKLRKKWYVKKQWTTWDICDKCQATAFALVRNHLAIKTSDIIDE